MPQKQLVYSDIEYLRYFNLKADSKKLSKETTYLINSLEGIQEDFKKTLLENKEITPKHEWITLFQKQFHNKSIHLMRF